MQTGGEPSHKGLAARSVFRFDFAIARILMVCLMQAVTACA